MDVTKGTETDDADLASDRGRPVRRIIEVTARNIWFLEKSIPIFGMLSFFPSDSIGSPEYDRSQHALSKARKLSIETDQGWSFTTDITSDSKIFRNKSRNRGTGKWVVASNLQPGDKIVIERKEEYHYFLTLERK